MESTGSIGNNTSTRVSELGYIVATAANKNFSNTGRNQKLVKLIYKYNTFNSLYVGF